MKSNEIILLGGGGHCKSCIDVIEQQGTYKIVGILDRIEKAGSTILNIPIIGCDDDIAALKDKIEYFLITVGQIRSPETRILLYDLLKWHQS